MLDEAVGCLPSLVYLVVIIFGLCTEWHVIQHWFYDEHMLVYEQNLNFILSLPRPLCFLLQVNAVNCNTSWKVTLFMKFSDYREDVLKGVCCCLYLFLRTCFQQTCM